MKKILTAALIFIINLSFFPIEIAHAANASLYITPASSTQAKGNNFTVYVGVNSGGNAVNAIEATVNLPASVVSISSAGTGGSLCSIWVQNPTVSGSSVSFKCGVPGGTTSNGNLISISLKANTVGSGTASITGARVFAGPGTDVTGGTSGGTINVTAPTPAKTDTAAPTVTSSSHGDQNTWYKTKNVALAWNRAAGITGFSYVFDQSESTVPAATANTNETTLNLADKADGTWYLHIRANSSNGWSSTTNYRVQIDTAAPTNLVILTDPKGESGKRPMVSFNAVDASSGIDRYEIKMDQEEFQKVTSPYTPTSIKSGEHTFTVRAYDKAGNMVEDKVTITIKDVPVPKITKPQSNAVFNLIQSLDIAGTADSTTKIDVYIDDVNIARGLTVNDDGSWEMTYKNFIMPGKHKITAIAVRDGIESRTSETVTIQTDPSAVNIFGKLVPSYVIFIGLLVIIGLLTLLIIWLIILVKRSKDKSHKKLKPGNLETNLHESNLHENSIHESNVVEAPEISQTEGSLQNNSSDAHIANNDVHHPEVSRNHDSVPNREINRQHVSLPKEEAIDESYFINLNK